MTAHPCGGSIRSWCEATNAEALEDLVTNQGVKTAPLPPEILVKLKEITMQTLTEAAAKDALVKKVHDSFIGFKSKVDKWARISEVVYYSQIRGQI